jgi:hypothetical protein
MSDACRKPPHGSDDGHSHKKKDKHKNKDTHKKKKSKTSRSGQSEEHIPSKKETTKSGRPKQNMPDEWYEKRKKDGLFHQASSALADSFAGAGVVARTRGEYHARGQGQGHGRATRCGRVRENQS